MESHSNLLHNKTVLITGSNRGIGKEIVQLFAQNGADIIACTRNQSPEFTAFTENLSAKYNSKIELVNFDLTNEIELKNAFKPLLKEKRRIDVLINNAGVAHGGLLQMTSITKIKEVFEVNFFAQLLVIQQISKIMMHQKFGSIINLASIAGIDSHPGYSAYGSSKAALIYATKTLSKELAPYNIRINAIAPGLTETDMANQMEKKAMETLISASAYNRLASPIEIANTALYLASDLSKFVNGQVIRVDGGI